MQNRSVNNFKGIDISNWQKGINLQELKNKGYEICYIKMTEGSTYQDPSFEENYKKAKDSNMKIGVYHFWRGTSNPETQVENILKTLGDKHIDCRIAIDVEAIDGLNNKEITNSVLKIAELLEEKTKNKPCIYCNTNFAKNILDNRLSKYPLWIAQYGVDKPSNNPIWDKWIGFQYSENGVSNINSSLDLDEFTYEILLDENDVDSSMIMELYDEKHNKILNLKDFRNKKIEHFYNEENKYLFVDYDIDSKDIKNIKKNYYIKTNKQFFKIILIKEDKNYKKLICSLDLDELQNKYFKEFNNDYNTINETFDLLLKDTGWSFEKSNITKKRLILKYNSNILNIIKRINEVFNIRVNFNTVNKKISIIPLLDKGNYNKNKLNITDDNLEYDDDYITRLVPIGKDGLTIEKINNGKDSIENYSYINTIKEVVWRDNSYLYAEDLKEDAILRLENRCKPYKKYTIPILDLVEQSALTYEDYQIGSKINIDEIGNLILIKLIEYPDNPEKNICVFANSTIKKIDPINKLKEISDIINAITVGDGVIDLKQLQGFKDSVLDSADISTILNQIKELNSTKANLTDLNSINANIKSLEAENTNIKNASIKNLNVINESIKNLENENANINKLVANKANIKDLESESAKIKTLQSDTANINTALISKASIDEVNSLKINTQELISKKADINELNTIQGNIEKLESSKANIKDLTAINGSIHSLQSDTASIKTVLNGNLSSENIQSGGITSDKLTIANGFIKDAMIDSMTADKINSGIINSSDVEIQSRDGNLVIKDNTIQIKDTTKVRVQMGKDANGDYNIYVWDINGNLMFDASGIKPSAIKNKIIRDDMISDTANIDFGKVNIESAFREINNSSNTIKASKINLDKENQILDIAFSQLQTSNNKNTNDITNAMTQIKVQQGQIKTSIENSKVIEGKQKTLEDNYNRTVLDVNSIKNTIGQQKTIIDTNTGKITGVETRTNTLEKNLNGVTSTLQQTNKTISDNKTLLETKTNELRQDVDGLNTNVSNIRKETDGKILLLNTTTSNLQTGINGISSKLESLKEETNGIDDKVNKNITEIKAIKGEVSSKVSETTLSNTVKTINNNIKIVTDKANENATLLKQTKDSITASVNSLNSKTETISGTINSVNSDLINKINTNLNVAKSYADSSSNNAKNQAISSANNYTNEAKSQAIKEAEGNTNNAIKNILVGSENLLDDSEKERTNYPNHHGEYLSINITDIIKNNLGKELVLSGEIKSLGKNGNINIYSLGRYTFNASKTVSCNTKDFIPFELIIKPSYNPTGDNGEVCNWSFYGTYDSGVFPCVRKLKVSLGNKTTPWCPSINDLKKYADDVAKAKADLAQANAIANADGKITAEEKARIEEAKVNLNTAIARADKAKSDAQVYSDNLGKQLKANAEKYANDVAIAKSELARTQSQAYVDGRITNEEKARISQAQANLNTAISKANEAESKAKVYADSKKQEAINTASTDATNKANNALNSAKEFTTAQITTTNSNLSKATSEINVLKEQINTKVGQVDVENSIIKAKTENYGYAYKKDIIVFGDYNLYYPVIIKGGNQNVKRKIFINRSYWEQAPSEWNPDLATHHGGLELLISANFGGWGGANYSWNIYDLEEMYSRMFAGAVNCASNMAFAIFLRGGGKNGAIYHLYSDQPLDSSIGWEKEDIPKPTSPQIAYNGEMISFYKPAYEFYAPKPRTITPEVEEEIKKRKFIQLTQDNATEITIANNKINDVSTKLTQTKDSLQASVNSLNSTTQTITTNLTNTTNDLNNKISIAKTDAINSSKSYADTKKNEAITSANSHADSVATTKANAAQSNAISSANSYTNSAKQQAIDSANSHANSVAEQKKNEAIVGARKIPDTRNDNQTPDWYIKNYPFQTITEFKFARVVKIPNASNNYNYGTLETKVPWGNSSGGYPTQIFRSSDYPTYQRHGINGTTWSSWEQIEDTQGSQSKADTALNNAKTYTNTQITTVNTRVSNAESSINVLKGQISTKVSQSDIDKTVNNIQIGGRNYIVLKNLSSYAPYNSISNENGIIKLVRNNNTNNFITLSIIGFTPENKKYTVSGICKLNGKPIPKDFFRLNKANTYNSGSSSVIVRDDGSFQITEMWTGSTGWILHTSTSTVAGDVITFEKLKFEVGNKATDWTPAPEDIGQEIKDNITTVTEKINTVESTLTQKTNNINATVSNVQSILNTKADGSTVSSMQSQLSSLNIGLNGVKTEVSKKADSGNIMSIINQSAESVKINANKIQLDGCTTLGNDEGRFVRINNANYTIRDNQKEYAFFGFQSDEKNGHPKLTMGADGLEDDKSYLTIHANPSTDIKAYAEVSYKIGDKKDYSNLKFYGGGDIKIAPLYDFSISSNCVNGTYQGQAEYEIARFSSSDDPSFDGNLQIPCVRNMNAGRGLILGDFHLGGSRATCVRVQTDDDNNHFFRPLNENGDIQLGSPSFRWYRLYSKYATSVSSHRYLKTNIVKFNDMQAYNNLKNMNIYTFNLKKFDENGNVIGYDNELCLGTMIDELPIECCDTGNTNFERQGVDMYGYTSYMASALKVAIGKIEVLEKEVQSLKSQINKK